MSWRDVVKGIKYEDEEWQKKLQEEIDSLDYVGDEEVLKPENKINPMNTEHMMDIFYFAARTLRNKHLKPEHKSMLKENLPILREQEKIQGITDEHIDAMYLTQDEDTDKRDVKFGYTTEPLHGHAYLEEEDDEE
jgi:hypothetical protein